MATPLGNLQDITLRALSVLREADLIICEDTRHTRKLLAHYQIAKPVLSCHEHNEETRTAILVEKIQSGCRAALVSDAGTPLISDPGFLLVQACRRANLRVIPVPGPSAPAAALSVSSLPPVPYLFAGFAPPRRGDRRRFLQRWGQAGCTVIFFEAPHRLERFLQDLLEVSGDRECLFCRELTKLHEEIQANTVAGLLAEVQGRPRIKGEITLVVGPHPVSAAGPAFLNPREKPADPGPVAGLEARYREMRAAGWEKKKIMAALVAATGLSRNQLYQLMLEWEVQSSK